MPTAIANPLPAAMHPPAADRYFTADGARLRYRDEGSGPALLLVHGWTLDLEMWDALTERTVTDPARLGQLIDSARRSGYSAVVDELAYGVIALAVPVFDQQGRVVAALNSSSHSRRISKAKLVRERLKMLQRVSQQISTDLATAPWLSLSAQV